MQFSILIPSWNNLPYLQWCVESIQKHASFPHQIIVHVNEGADGTLDWVKTAGVDYTASATNIGICRAVNQASALIRHDYVVFMNDDMYCLPGWDTALAEEIAALPTDCFMLSATMIEPVNTRNPCVVVRNYGQRTEDFEETRLLKEYRELSRTDWSGSTWPPNVVHREWWQKVGGYSEEFSPGMSSDDDFAMKMWQAGCRIYKGVGRSLVYHFISKSTQRVIKNDGRKQFLAKWGIKQSAFHRFYTHRGRAYTGPLTAPRFHLRLMWHKALCKVIHK